MRHYLEEHFLGAWGNSRPLHQGAQSSEYANTPEIFHKRTFFWDITIDASQSPAKLFRKNHRNMETVAEEWGVLPDNEDYSQPLSAHGKLWILVSHEEKWTLYSAPLAQEKASWSPHAVDIHGDIKTFAADRNNDPVVIADSEGYLKITGKFTGGGGGIAWEKPEKISVSEYNAFLKANAVLEGNEEMYGEFDLHRQGAMLALAWKTAADGGAKIRYRVSKGPDEPYGAWRTPTGSHSAKLDETAQFLQYHLTTAMEDEQGKRIWPDIQLSYRFEDSGAGRPLPLRLDTGGSSSVSVNNLDFPQDKQSPSANEQEKPSIPDLSETNPPSGDSQEKPKRDKSDNPEKTSSDAPSNAPDNNHPQNKDRSDSNPHNPNESDNSKQDKPLQNTPHNQPQRSIQSPYEPDGDPNSGGEKAPAPQSSPNPSMKQGTTATNPPTDQKAPSCPEKKETPNRREKDNPSEPSNGNNGEDSSGGQGASPTSTPNSASNVGQGGVASRGDGGNGSAGSESHPSSSPKSPTHNHPDSIPYSPIMAVNSPSQGNNNEKQQNEPADGGNHNAAAGDQGEASSGTKNPAADSNTNKNHPGKKDLGSSSGDAPVGPETEEDGFHPGHQGGGGAAGEEGESQESQRAPSAELPGSRPFQQPYLQRETNSPITAGGGSGGGAGRSIVHATAASLGRIKNPDRKTNPSPLGKRILPGCLGFLLFFLIWRKKKQEEANSSQLHQAVDSSSAACAPDAEKWSSFLQENDSAHDLGWDKICSFDSRLIALSVSGERAALMKDDGRLWTGSSRYLFEGCDGKEENAVLTLSGNLDRQAKNACLALGKNEFYIAAEDRRGRSLSKAFAISPDGSELSRKFAAPKELKSLQRLCLVGKRILAAGFSTDEMKVFEASIGPEKIGHWQEMRPEGLKEGKIVAVSSGSDTLVAGTPANDPHTLWLYEKSAKGWRPLATIDYRGDEILLYSEPKRCFMMDRTAGDKTFRFQAFTRDEKGQFTGKLARTLELPGDFSLSAMNIWEGRLILMGRENTSSHSRLIFLAGRLREFLKMNIQTAA
ncbi:MAG: hypothetical protein AB1656_05585 [Candidatus Omnitrophota bacterium]